MQIHPSDIEHKIILTVAPANDARGARIAGHFEAKLGNRVIIRATRQPLLDGARALMALGVDATAAVIMRHVGSEADCITTKIDTAARLTVKDRKRGGLAFEQWSPFSSPVELCIDLFELDDLGDVSAPKTRLRAKLKHRPHRPRYRLHRHLHLNQPRHRRLVVGVIGPPRHPQARRDRRRPFRPGTAGTDEGPARS